MAKILVITIIGRDRIGIVEHVTNQVLRSHSNISSSRMAHLGGEFTMMMQISVPNEKFDDLKENLDKLKTEGFLVNIVETNQEDKSKFAGWVPYQINIIGADHEGVVHDVSQYFTKYKINIESMETSITSAPMSGTPLFSIYTTVMIPPDLNYQDFADGLEVVSDDLNMELEIVPHES
ncbi:MAG: transcriptional regulator [Proteobacteria bacterium]|nr:transcriptional regulator [Pseudomonadota bacterium]